MQKVVSVLFDPQLYRLFFGGNQLSIYTLHKANKPQLVLILHAVKRKCRQASL